MSGIQAIGKGGKQVENKYFCMVYWYYRFEEISDDLLRGYRRKGVRLQQSSKSLFLSFHLDEIHPSALRKSIKVAFLHSTCTHRRASAGRRTAAGVCVLGVKEHQHLDAR